MKRKLVKLRPSPNEEARIIREEHDRRRKLRIQQVREQQRHISQQIRQAVEQRRQQELELLGEQLRRDWERQQQEKLHTLQRLYQESLQMVGQGHRSAKENEPDLAAIARREEENHARADQRHREALKELKSQRLKEHERQSRLVSSRKKALQTEKERSAKVVRLPPPPPNPVQNIDYKKPHVVKKSDVSAFAATHYNMPESAVDREDDAQQTNAHEEAELEVRRQQELQREETRRREEQLEKARLRGRQALRREQLVQDRERLLVELEHMQQTDLLRRRQQVSQMPPQIFQPLYKRQETRDDFQREVEFAFEDMITGERRVKGDLVLQLAPEPLPALSTGSQDQELDVTLEEVTTPGTENSSRGAEQEAESSEQETSAQVEPSKPAPRRALKKLLDRIRGQRNQWADHSSRVSPADSPTGLTDQIPERDTTTTIETGSLTSEERDRPAPSELPQPVLSPPDKTSTIVSSLETSEPSPAANTRLPDKLENRIQDFGEERKKREEELERQKQQQVVLLQELEKQKVKLEQMLLEAQQEREHLKAAAGTQEVDLNQSDVTDRDQEVASVPTGPAPELEPPAGEDDHHRRIREYQQRLLEQNRIHQRSVEVARQRLDEYQRALRIRYSMTSPLLLSTVVPPGRPPLHLPAPRPLTTTPAVPSFIHNKPLTSIEVPTRESDILASPPRPPGSSLSAGSKLLPEEVESRSRNQRPDVSSWLTDNIMERVTEHLPQRVRASSLPTEPPPPKRLTAHPSTNIPVHRSSDPIQATSLWDDAPPVPGPAEVQPGIVWTGSLQTLSSRRDHRERQRRELQEFQRRVQEQREAIELQQEEERRRGEVQRHVKERRKAVDLQQEEDKRRGELQEVQRRMQQQREAVELQQEEERRRGELQEVQRRMQEQREAVELQQEEERRRRGDEMEQMRQQKEALKALIHTDEQPVPDAPSDELVSESSGQTRLRLLAFLLRAIEESNGGTLSHLQDPDSREASPHLPLCGTDPTTHTSVPAPASVLLPELLPPPVRAAKPPVTRMRLGLMEATEQHELSAIQEVDTSVNNGRVTGPEKNLNVPSHAVNWDPQEESDLSVSSDRTLDTPSLSSSGRRTADSPSSFGTNSETSHRHIWRERLLTGAGVSPESSESDLVLRMISAPSSDSGRGADFSGPAATSCRSFTESALRPPDPDCLSSTSLSTGSYVTTDPEQNVNTDKSPPVTLCEEQGADRLSFIGDTSPARRHGAAVQTLFNDGSIQRIIERYTRELNFSLSSAGRATDSEASYVDEPGSVGGASETRVEGGGSAGRPAPPTGTRTQRDLDRDFTVRPILDHFSGYASSQAEDSFRPLIGRLAEQSSCLAADQRDSAMEQLVGQPSAHSSMIGQLPVGVGQGGWDSTLSRMIGRLSHLSGPSGPSGWQDASQLMGPMVAEQSTTWLDEVQEESQMRALVGEPDTDQHSGVSGDRTHVDPSVPAEASLPSHWATVPAASPHPQDQIPQNQTGPMDLDPDRTDGETTVNSSDQRPYVFPGSDSFHPLLAEVTHNDTADPSMTFHLLAHKGPSSPELTSEGRSVSSRPEGSDSPGGSSVGSDPSPERLRSENPASQELLQDRTQDSALELGDTTSADVELMALSLSNLTMRDGAPAADTSQPAGGAAERFLDSVQFTDVCEEMRSEPGSSLRRDIPLFHKILEAACETGILEQSEITLVSLTDEETTITEEEGAGEETGPDEEGQTSKETEGAESTLLPEDGAQSHPEVVLEVHWGLSRRLQDVNEQKRRALLQRSSRRVEGIRAKVAVNKNRAEAEAREEESEFQLQTDESKAGESETSGFIQQRKGQPPPPASSSVLKEVKIFRPEQRKRDVCEMYQRTQRLFHQLEEVKQQKTIRSRQEASAQNRLKAKEFHKKTLEKLRAKQTQQ